MAERFTNFLRKFNNGSQVVVPASAADVDERTNGSVVQVHSLYISLSRTGTWTEEQRQTLSNYVNCDIYISDPIKGQIYIAYGVLLVPGCPFYIEKNITLTENQSLNVNVSNPTNTSINVVASAVEFTEDTEEF
jgi:hypothetical protein